MLRERYGSWVEYQSGNEYYRLIIWILSWAIPWLGMTGLDRMNGFISVEGTADASIHLTTIESFPPATSGVSLATCL